MLGRGPFPKPRDPQAPRSARLDLRQVDLRRADLIDAHLEGAVLGRAHLEWALLQEARLDGAFLQATHLEGAELTGTRHTPTRGPVGPKDSTGEPQVSARATSQPRAMRTRRCGRESQRRQEVKEIRSLLVMSASTDNTGFPGSTLACASLKECP